MLRENSELRDKTVKLLQKCDFAIRGIKIENVPAPSEVLDAMPVPPEMRRELEVIISAQKRRRLHEGSRRLLR
jgi:hypothetical protein